MNTDILFSEDSESNSEEILIDGLELSEKTELALVNVSDNSLVNIRPFRTLTLNDKPIKPMPSDDYSDTTYPQFFEQRCSICTSPYRNLAEHVYLDEGKKPQKVINFFLNYFNAKLNWVQVQTHMDQHCNFSKISTSGIENYIKREEELGTFRYREQELAMIAIIVELDDIRGMDCSKSNDMKLKRASMVERLAGRLMDLKAKRDASLVDSTVKFNIFEVLMDIHEKLETEADKRIVREKVKELRERLLNG